jgi:hypothetical protein
LVSQDGGNLPASPNFIVLSSCVPSVHLSTSIYPTPESIHSKGFVRRRFFPFPQGKNDFHRRLATANLKFR